MTTRLNPPASIVFFGLDESLAAELRDSLRDPRRSVHTKPLSSVSECRRAIHRLGADLVFCPAEEGRYRVLLEAVKMSKPEIPVVVVSRHPQVSQWLDALEDGAADYCAAPFETVQLQWILDSCLHGRGVIPGRQKPAGKVL